MKDAIKLAKAKGLRVSSGGSLKESYNSFLEAARRVQWPCACRGLATVH